MTGVSKTTIIQGKKELEHVEESENSRIRKSGGGRKPVTEKYLEVKEEIEKIAEADTLPGGVALENVPR